MNPYEKLGVDPLYSKKEVDETYKLLLKKHSTDIEDETTQETKEAYTLLEISFQQFESIKKYRSGAEKFLTEGAILTPVKKSRKRFSKPKIKLENGTNHANFTYPTINSSISNHSMNMKGLPMKRVPLMLALFFVILAPFISDPIYELVYHFFK